MLFVVSAFGRTSAPMDNRGFTFKLKDLGNGIKLIEEYEEDGTKKKARNHPKKERENEVDWIIYQPDEKQDWKKVYAMDVKKN